MNKDRISILINLALAKAADPKEISSWPIIFAELFEAEIRTDEREACAKVAEDMDRMVLALLNVTRQPIAIAAAIRARGEVK